MKEEAYLKRLHQGCFPTQPVYSPLLHQPHKVGENLFWDTLNARRHCGSTDLLLQPHGPTLSLQRNPVGAGERTEQGLGIGL